MARPAYWTLLIDGIPQGKLTRELISTALREDMPDLSKGEDFPDVGQYDIQGKTIVIVRIPEKPAKQMVLVA